MPSTESVSHDDLIVCACGDQEYKARDAIHATLFRSELQSTWTDFLRRVEAERRADEMEMDFDGSALDSAAEVFRYEHDLITAEGTELWLAARGLTLDASGDYFAVNIAPACSVKKLRQGMLTIFPRRSSSASCTPRK